MQAEESRNSGPNYELTSHTIKAHFFAVMFNIMGMVYPCYTEPFNACAECITLLTSNHNAPYDLACVDKDLCQVHQLLSANEDITTNAAMAVSEEEMSCYKSELRTLEKSIDAKLQYFASIAPT